MFNLSKFYKNYKTLPVSSTATEPTVFSHHCLRHMIRTGGHLRGCLDAAPFSPGGLAVDPAERWENDTATKERLHPPPPGRGAWEGRGDSEEDCRSENG